MSCNVDKVKAIDGVMGADVIPVENLSAELRTRLESPFPQQGQSGEWSDLNRELSRHYKNDEGFVIVQSSTNPIFRENDLTRPRNPEIITQYISNISSEGEFQRSNSIFLVIDFSNFENNNYSVDVARKQMDSWCKYISNCLKKITPEPPRIVIHVRTDKEDATDPITIYNNKYHSKIYRNKSHSISLSPTELDLVLEAPTIIIDCAPIENHLKDEYLSKNDFYSDFLVLYSTINPEECNDDENIQNTMRKISDGFTILHQTRPNMKVVAKLLEFACKLAIKHTIHTNNLTLFEDFRNQTFASSRKINTSKSASLIGKEGGNEMGQISSSIFKKFSDEWQGYEGDGFYESLKEYDQMCETLDYDTSVNLRHHYERLRDNIKKFLFTNYYFDADKRWPIDGGNTKERQYLLFAHTLEDQPIKKESKTSLNKQIFEGISNSTELISLDQLLENDNSSQPINGRGRDVIELLKILLKCMDGEIFNYLSKSNHPIGWRDISELKEDENIGDDKKDMFSELIKLQKHHIKFSLIKHISAHGPLQEFLNNIKDEMNNCKEPEVQEWIYKFFNLKPINEGDLGD